MIKISAILYLLICFKLCFVNNQHLDGMIKLEQGNVIGVRIIISNIYFYFQYFLLV